MKRWAVFDTPTYYPSGGMTDFVGAFDTKEEAELFIARTIYNSDMNVEDMFEFLSKESPKIPTQKEFDDEIEKRRLARIALEQE